MQGLTASSGSVLTAVRVSAKVPRVPVTVGRGAGRVHRARYGILGLVVVSLTSGLAGAAVTPRTELVSVTWNGSWIGDGRYAIFYTPARNVVRSHRTGIFLRDRRRRTTTLVLPRSGAILRMTPDARVIVFCTSEPLSPRDAPVTSSDFGRYGDVYVYDRRSRKIMWASTRFRNGRSPMPEPACDGQGEHASGGTPGISADGRLVVFSSRASNLVRGDTNRTWDVFVRDLVARKTRRVSLTSGGGQLHGVTSIPTISANGRYVFFCSNDRRLVGRGQGILMRDLRTHTTRLVSTLRNGRSLAPFVDCSADLAVSADGRYLAFETRSPDLVQPPPEHAQLVVKDLKTQSFDLVTRGIDGRPANASSFAVEMSHNGRYMAFSSTADNLVPGDVRDQMDIFWFDRVRRARYRVNVRADGRESRTSPSLSLSSDGRWVLWSSNDPDVIPGDPHRWPREETYDDFVRGPLH